MCLDDYWYMWMALGYWIRWLESLVKRRRNLWMLCVWDWVAAVIDVIQRGISDERKGWMEWADGMGGLARLG